MTKTTVSLFAMVVAIFAMSQPASAAEWRGEWETALQRGKAEGKIVLGIPPSAELRKELEPLLKQKFGIDAELLVSRARIRRTRSLRSTTPACAPSTA